MNVIVIDETNVAAIIVVVIARVARTYLFF